MNKFLFSLLECLFIQSETICGQSINNTSAERNIDKSHYARLQYENDFYAKTDYYSTQGIFLEVVHHAIKKFPLAKLLWKPQAA